MEENIEISEVTEEINVEKKKKKLRPKLTDAEIQSRYREFLKRGR